MLGNQIRRAVHTTAIMKAGDQRGRLRALTSHLHPGCCRCVDGNYTVRLFSHEKESLHWTAAHYSAAITRSNCFCTSLHHCVSVSQFIEFKRYLVYCTALWRSNHIWTLYLCSISTGFFLSCCCARDHCVHEHMDSHLTHTWLSECKVTSSLSYHHRAWLLHEVHWAGGPLTHHLTAPDLQAAKMMIR